MPPKRKVPARRASPGKKVRIGSSSDIASPTTASGRPRRSVAVEVNYQPLSTRHSETIKKKQTKIVEDGPNAQTATITPRKRGRPSKAKVTATTSVEEDTTTNAANPVKAARGRPKKLNSVTEAISPKATKRKREDEGPDTTPPKKRGRPPNSEKAVTKPRRELPTKVEKGARKIKEAAQKIGPAVADIPARKGRPPSSKNRKTRDDKAEKSSKDLAPKKSIKQTKEDFVDGLTQEDGEDASDMQYWLMKAEPDSRIVKGIDVAFSIDMLARAVEPEPWDGVRNPVARNNMRAMRKGDLAFFYHSNCLVPSIVGVMRVAEEHSIDESAFDPAHPYYDEKSIREKPKWDCVKVEFVKKLAEPVTLKQVKNSPELSTMQLAQKAFGRLSVQRVTSDQWRTILNMAKEPEDLGVVAITSGYEADTNGETDKEAAEESVGIDDVDDGALEAYGNSANLVDDNAAITDDLDTETLPDETAKPLVNGRIVAVHQPQLSADYEDGNLASGEGA